MRSGNVYEFWGAAPFPSSKVIAISVYSVCIKKRYILLRGAEDTMWIQFCENVLNCDFTITDRKIGITHFKCLHSVTVSPKYEIRFTRYNIS